MFRVLQGNRYREKKTFTYRNPSVGIKKIKTDRLTIRINGDNVQPYKPSASPYKPSASPYKLFAFYNICRNH